MGVKVIVYWPDGRWGDIDTFGYDPNEECYITIVASDTEDNVIDNKVKILNMLFRRGEHQDA